MNRPDDKNSRTAGPTMSNNKRVEDELDELAVTAAQQTEVDPGQLKKWKAGLLQDLHPVRSGLPTVVFAITFALAFAALALLSVYFLHAYGWQVMMPLQKVTIFASLIAAAALLAITLSREMVPGSKLFIHPGLLMMSLFVLFTLVVASVFQVRVEKHFLHHGQICLELGLPFALPAAAIFGLILRKGAIMSRRWTAALTGMLAGLVSTSALEIHCPNQNMWHVLVWHFGIPLLGIGVGLLFAAVGEAIRHRSR